MTPARGTALVAAALAAAGSLFPPAAQAQRSPTSAFGARLASADSAYAAGARNRAERAYAAIVAEDSAQSHAIFRLAQLREGRDLGTSIALYHRYVALQPRDAWGFIALGDALGAAGDLSGALAAYDRAGQLAPAERDVNVGRARLLARAGHTDEAIAAYERWLARTPGDAQAWRDLAVQRRRAGRSAEAIVALDHAAGQDATAATKTAVAKDLLRARNLARGTVTPVVAGSRDSDGLTTARAGVTVSSALLGRARVSASTSVDRAGDGVTSRGTEDASLGLHYRPLAQLRLGLAAGVSRGDRSLVDTVAGASRFETVPVGQARLVWRKPGDAIGVDLRASRQLIDASPLLVAQGVLRDEASLSLDLRLAGPFRVRGFGRVGSVHDADESNGRRILGGALAYAPGEYEVSLRAQTMRYDTATALAYFSPRQVRTAELTTYFERETDRGVTMAVDLGGGAQQVFEWTAPSAAWSPELHAWAQLVVPLNDAFALGTELEAYDSRVGTETQAATVGSTRWRYGSASVSLRVRI